ncbi:MAG TPA: aromatic ring-hydroxylating dioxygenase subunit alpha [Gaiellaceae bacterium]|nr:aromatic ring-hydroxylating dioxygenase subunit alpha [Gaiellaceae bacterium]
MNTTTSSRTIPWEWYVSSEVLRREQELVFRDAWHYAGPAEWVAEPGDRFPATAGEAPVAVVRGPDGELRAFLNVCRHRGSVIVKGRGRARTLQCPYHAWTYGLDGGLRSAPRSEREPDFDPCELGLRPALVETWGPFVFVNTDLDAAPRATALGALPELVDPGGLVFRERVSFDLAVNWKVAAENYLECYHCPTAHKAFSALVDVDPDAYRLETAGGVLSQYGDRRGGGEGEDGCQFHLAWPALKVIVYPGAANLSLGPLWPTGPESAAGFLDYFFGPDVPEQTQRELIEFDDQVGREDRELVESVQRGIRSGLIEDGRLLLDSERLIAAFQERLTVVLGSGL